MPSTWVNEQLRQRGRHDSIQLPRLSFATTIYTLGGRHCSNFHQLGSGHIHRETNRAHQEINACAMTGGEFGTVGHRCAHTRPAWKAGIQASKQTCTAQLSLAGRVASKCEHGKNIHPQEERGSWHHRRWMIHAQRSSLHIEMIMEEYTFRLPICLSSIIRDI